eukprot:COSAG02_NODE_172_length_31318_cov_18.709568_3_plen_79_part_00
MDTGATATSRGFGLALTGKSLWLGLRLELLQIVVRSSWNQSKLEDGFPVRINPPTPANGRILFYLCTSERVELVNIDS